VGDIRASWVRVSADAMLIILFAVVLLLPVAEQLIGIDHTTAPVEKRRLAKRPALRLDAETLDGFPERFTAYYRDNFGFRNRLIRWHNRVKVRWLHASPSANVVLGNNGYLYFAGGDTMEYYRSVKPLSPEELEQWLRALEERRDWLAARGAGYLVVIAPSKQSIYPEYVPGRFNRVQQASRLDQLLKYMGDHSDFEILDLRGPLIEAKKQSDVYERTDTHWNDLGAHIAYSAIVEHLSTWFPNMTPYPRSSYEVLSREGPGIDLAQLLGMEDVITDTWVSLLPQTPRLAEKVDPGYLLPLHEWGVTPPIVMQHPDSSLPRAVVLRDSFAIRFIPFLSEHFSRVAYLWEYGFDTAAIEREQPDVVIHEIAERVLIQDWSIPVNPATMSDDLLRP